MNETALEKRDRKLLNAIKAGARIVENGFGKVLFEVGKGNVINTGQRLDYKRIWGFHCASDMIARQEWFSLMSENLAIRDRQFHRLKDYYVVIIPFRKFKNYVGKRNMRVQEAIDIFKSMPRIVFESSRKNGSVKLNISGEWRDITFASDNICGVMIASEQPTLEDIRSMEKKLRGRPRKSDLKSIKEIEDREEPVFILIFSNLQGRAFVESAMKRHGCRLHYLEMYQLDGRAQELYESIRWWGNKTLVHLDMEYISQVVGWKWPIHGKQQIYKRRKSCQKLIDILYEEGFIAKPMPPTGKGEKTCWHFFIRKVRGPEINKRLGVT
jgi:hypothetical protein